MESVAKRPRLEPRNAEKIIKELRAQLATKDERIQELEQENFESPNAEGNPRRFLKIHDL